MLNYLIRTCEPHDLHALVELCAAHARFEQATYTKVGKEELLRKALFQETPSLFCWVVEMEGLLAGYTTYTFDYSTWDAQRFLYLDCLYLEPAARGRGIGEEIIKRLQHTAREEGCVNLQWQTPSFNEKAIRFYRRIGGFPKEKIRFSIPTS